MAKMKLLQDFSKNALTEKESKEVKGGKSYVPSNTGSVGYINWDDVGIRDNEFVPSTSSGVQLNLGAIKK